MASYWHKHDWLPEDLDRSDPYLPTYFPHAIPPGIYCEDEAARAVLMKGASKTVSSCGMDLAAAGFGYSLAGTPVYVATPAQLAVLKAMPAKTPEEARAEQAEQAVAATSAWAKLAEGIPGLSAGLPVRRASRPAPPVPPTRHPFHGANRALRRAQAAEARRRA